MSKDWTEDFEHENGMYQNICKICNSKFMGHKIRRVCKECYTQQQGQVQPVVKVNFADILDDMIKELQTEQQTIQNANRDDDWEKYCCEVCDNQLKILYQLQSKISA